MKSYIIGLLACLGLLTAILLCGPGLSPALYPALPRPHLLVETHWPSAGAKEIDREVTLPLLSAFSTLEGLQKSIAESENGHSRIHLTFTHSTSASQALSRVQMNLAKVIHQLPGESHHPQVRAQGQNVLPVFAVAFPLEKKRASQDFQTEAEKLSGVSLSHTGEERESNLTLEYNSHSGSRRNISSHTAAALLQDRSFAFTLSSDDPHLLMSVSVPPADFLEDPQLQGLIRRSPSPAAPPSSIHRLNGRQQHIVLATADKEGQHIRICRRLSGLSENYNSAHIVFNRGRELEKLLFTTAVTVLVGLLGVACLVVSQVGHFDRELVLMMCSLPILLLTGVTALSLCSISLDIMGLAGIAVSCGLLVDGAVLFYEEKSSHGAAAASAAVRAPILLSNITSISIFIPILLLPVTIRSNLEGFMVVMTTILVCGTLWTLGIFPRFCRPAPVHGQVEILFHRRFRYLPSLLQPICGKAVLCLLIYVSLCLLPLFYAGGLEFRYFPHISQRTIHLRIEFPAGTRAEYIDQYLQSYFQRVQQLPQVQALSVDSHSGQAAFSVICSRSRDSSTVQRAINRIPLPPHATLIMDSKSTRQRSFQVLMYGSEEQELRLQVQQTAALIQSHNPEYQIYFHFKTPPPVYRLTFESEAAARRQISPLQAAGQLHRLITTAPAAKLGITPQQDVRLRANYGAEDFHSLYNSLRIVGPEESFPLTAIALLTTVPALGMVRRSNQALFSGFSVVPPAGHRQAIDSVSAVLDRLELPAGYSTQLAPVLQVERAHRNWVLLAIGLASILVPLLLYSYYNQTSRTLFVLSFIPPALSAPLLPLYWLGVPLSIPVLTGFLVNVGISVNNGVVLLSETKSGPLRRCDLIRALCTKLPSLTASTFTTAAGVIPLLFGAAEGYGILAGLSIVVATGTTVSWAMLFLGTAAFSPITLVGNHKSI
ncbi:MAG: efflux RND transporter permease subunit [Spirochaetaceae bacterium]|nr:efflux RND transporter permease subunit [Spirochaetaceae bacterium]MCF7950755.1 efflux RND transporter permease subunit [Spirochaetaceae bacterium]